MTKSPVLRYVKIGKRKHLTRRTSFQKYYKHVRQQLFAAKASATPLNHRRRPFQNCLARLQRPSTCYYLTVLPCAGFLRWPFRLWDWAFGAALEIYGLPLWPVLRPSCIKTLQFPRERGLKCQDSAGRRCQESDMQTHQTPKRKIPQVGSQGGRRRTRP